MKKLNQIQYYYHKAKLVLEQYYKQNLVYKKLAFGGYEYAGLILHLDHRVPFVTTDTTAVAKNLAIGEIKELVGSEYPDYYNLEAEAYSEGLGDSYLIESVFKPTCFYSSMDHEYETVSSPKITLGGVNSEVNLQFGYMGHSKAAASVFSLWFHTYRHTIQLANIKIDDENHYFAILHKDGMFYYCYGNDGRFYKLNPWDTSVLGSTQVILNWFKDSSRSLRIYTGPMANEQTAYANREIDKETFNIKDFSF